MNRLSKEHAADIRKHSKFPQFFDKNSHKICEFRFRRKKSFQFEQVQNNLWTKAV
jgi:hypothetical protein